MVFTILISIVFIAEIIITIAVFRFLFSIDKKILDINDTIILAKPSIKDVSELVKKISEQYVEISEHFVDDFKDNQEKFVLKQLTKFLGALILWRLNSKAINKIRKSRVTKFIGKGLSLLENMV